MKWIQVVFVAVCGAMALASSAEQLHAQAAAQSGTGPAIALTSSAPSQDTSALEITQDDWGRGGWGRAVLRVGQDYALKVGETVREVVVVFSPTVIEGHVRRDVIVVLGTVQIASTAVIGGSLVVIGGNVTVQQGASVREDLVVVGGGLDAPADFNPGRQHIAIGANKLADGLRTLVPWMTEGLLLGRPIVPRLSWVWLIVGFVFAVSLALCLLFMDSVRKSADVIAAKPFTTFLVGLLVLLLTGPVSVVLAASVIGILVVPFVLCAVVVAWIIGKVGVSVCLGNRMVGQTSPASRLHTVRSFTIGFAALCLIYMVPVLGFMAWALVGVTGLGAAALAFTSAYRRENPATPKPTPPAPREPGLTPGIASPAAPVFMSDLSASAHLPTDAPPLAYATGGAAAHLLVFPKAGFFERMAALALDMIFVVILCGIFDVLRDGPGPVIFAMLTYHIGFWAWKGTTFGGIVCQLRVIRLDGSALRFVDAMVRGIASIFSLAVAGLGCLWILRDEERQAWHDKIAGTYVVTVPRNWPLS